jgi:hypothetical protein
MTYSRQVTTMSRIYLISPVLQAHRKEYVHLIRFTLTGHDNHQQLLQNASERRETLDEFRSSKESGSFCQFLRFDIVQAESNGGEDFAELGHVGIPADIEFKRGERWVSWNVDMGELVRLHEEGFEGCEMYSRDLAIEKLTTSAHYTLPGGLEDSPA